MHTAWTIGALAALGACAGWPKPAPDAEPLVYVPYKAGTPAMCVSTVPAAERSGDGEAALVAGIAHIRAGDLTQASLVLSEAGDTVAARSARASLAFLEGDIASARSAFRDLVALWPEDGCLAQAAAYTYLVSGQLSYARTLSADARKRLPDEAEVLFLDGIMAAMAGDDDKAAATYRAALALAPGHPALSAALGSIYVQRGDALLALPLLETAARAGFDVDGLLIVAWYGAGRTADYIRGVAAAGYPIPGAAAVAAADDPEAAYLAALGVSPEQRLVAVMVTSMGTLHCDLMWREAPVAVGNFVGLARGELPWEDPVTGVRGSGPFYDGTIFHRVIPEFMVQGGDRAGTGTGGPGYAFPDEVAPDLGFNSAGMLAMANHGPNTNGSQFFVTEAPVPHLNGGYTIFGQCDDASVDVVKAIARVPRAAADKPVEDVVLEQVEIRGQ